MASTTDLHLVPESLLKKRHDLDTLKAKRAAALIANPRVSRKRISDKSKVVRIIKPETLLVQSRARRNAATRYNRVAKRGMQKRASDKSVVKNKYWDGAREEEAEETDVLKYKQQKEQGDEKDSDDEVMEEKKDVKKKSDKETNEQLQIHEIPYKSNSVGAAVIFAVLIRPCVHNTPKTVRRTLSTLRLRRVQEGVFLRYTPSMRKMLHLVEPYVLYGIPSVETISDLVHRRGYCRVEGKRVQISDNNVIEQQLGNVGLICVEDLIQVLSSGEGGQEENLFQAVSKFLWPFRLSSRKSKFQKRMLDLKDGKLYGDQGEAMNGYIREML
ncbi:hypothetical protein HJC23_006075 [Cyclotella cryptica]|uniref:Large ribosomal subunit protein uL30-like ferredoxin-like fold domain-containing protein n=1 Tax=Cyclotella cryptica TaxID=29204 RepID=A0ABD3QJD8_9STRA